MVALSLCSVVPLLFLITETYSHAKQKQEAMALYKKGVELGNLHHDEEALDAYNELITHFDSSKDPKIQQLVAQASHKKRLSFVGSYVFPILQQVLSFIPIDLVAIVTFVVGGVANKAETRSQDLTLQQIVAKARHNLSL